METIEEIPDDKPIARSPRGRKGEQTREHILSVALDRFAQKGYAATTMREIATTADVSLGLTYRYFASKEDLVVGLYERLVSDLEEEARALGEGGRLAEQVIALMRADLRRCAPYRAAFGALAGIGLMPESDVAVLGKRAEPVRARVWNAFYRVVTGASDGMKGQPAREMTTLLYAAHLLLILFWVQDRSANQQATEALLQLGEETLRRYRFLLRIPQVGGLISRLSAILEPMLGLPGLGLVRESHEGSRSSDPSPSDAGKG